MKADRVYAIIVAAGSGKRMGASIPKQLMAYRGSCVLGVTLNAFLSCEAVDRIILVSPEDGSLDAAYREIVTACETATGSADKLGKIVITRGGKERSDSVKNGLSMCRRLEDEYKLVGTNAGNPAVLIHDAARPGVTQTVIERNIAGLDECRAVVTCVPSVDSVRLADKNTVDFALNKQAIYPIMKSTVLERQYVYNVQTPQSFYLDDIIEAYRFADAKGYTGTDDASVAAFAGIDVAIVEGSRANNKITTIEDLPMATRVGTGFDVHKLVSGRELILCGTPVPNDKGLLGHSDADVATHALMDALLGAAGMGDIGRHFPDTDERYKGADSIKLLEEVMRIIADYRVVNADITIICQSPKLAPYNAQMRTNIARALGVAESAVNISATTTEGLGFTGQGEGIAAIATCSIEGRN